MAEEPTPPANPDAAAIKEIQAAAKWLVAALGAVAAILVSGLSLSDIGAVEDGNAWVAAAGVLLATGGVVYLLYLTLDVLVVEPPNLDSLADLEDADITVLAPATTADEFAQELPVHLAEVHDAYGQHLADVSNDAIRTRYKLALSRSQQWLNGAEKALTRKRLQDVRKAFSHLRGRKGVLGVALVIVGVTVSAFGLSGPKVQELSIDSVLKTPSEVVVQFVGFDSADSADDVPEYVEAAGIECVNAGVAQRAVALGSSADSYVLALMESDQCPPVVITVDSSEALVALPPE